MDVRLHRLLMDRLDADRSLPAEAAVLVLAACEGDDASAEAVDPPAVHLRAITVEGFRGVGPRARLDLEPGPGLTLVVGRNGTGKSSFAEALEICLTGQNRRWQERATVWRDGWRNIHSGEPCRVSAELCVDGVPGAVTASRTWGPADALDGSTTALAGHPTATSIDDLGWTAALTSLRPFLSYNELGSMFQGGPSGLYDALAAILGLDDLLAVSATLKDDRTDREKAMKSVRDEVPALATQLGEVVDPRATACATALASEPWDLDAIELALAGVADSADPEGDLATLRSLSETRRTGPEVTPEALRTAALECDRQAGTDAGSAMRVADLLEKGLAHHEHAGDETCPLCGTGTLDAAWRARAVEEQEQLTKAAESAMTARKALTEAMAAAGRSIDPRPAVLGEGGRVGIETDPAIAAWDEWLAGIALGDPREMADHLQACGPALDEELDRVRASAAAEITRREDAWRPVARDLRRWRDQAVPAVVGATGIPDLKTAEAWVKKVTDAVRAERFAPISQAAEAHWALLRQNSSVAVTGIGLAGAATQRRVQIDVSIDGVARAALGVMSQGELCSLALCMFLPRATLDESPFRFVVIDDPVQSMDPSKVDGLARVLESVAATRQVVVFTHDDRLPEAVRRLRVDARIIEVGRSEGSVVRLAPGLDPVEARLDDARAAARDEKLPPRIAARVVPGLCRQAIEAACLQAVRRRRLARGEAHTRVEALLTDVTGLYESVALALFDDRGKQQQGKVLVRLNQDHAFGSRAANAFVACNRGAHEAYPGDLADLTRDATRLARALAERA